MTEETELTSHPAADIFPQMNASDYRKLKADIEKNRLHEEIITYKGQILDGRHRYRACTEAGIDTRFRNYEGDDPLGFVLSINLHRRHLSPSRGR